MNINLKLRNEFRDHQGAIKDVGFHGDGKIFFARSDDLLIIYDVERGAKMKGFYDSEGYISAAFDPSGRMLMFMSGDAVHYFDLACWQERMVYQGELKEIRDSDAHLGAGLWAKADQTGGINVYRVGADEDEPPEFTLQGHTHYVEYLTFHPTGKILASGSADNTIRFWDLTSASEISSHKVHDDFVTSLGFNRSGNLLVSGDYSGCLKVWDFSAV